MIKLIYLEVQYYILLTVKINMSKCHPNNVHFDIKLFGFLDSIFPISDLFMGCILYNQLWVLCFLATKSISENCRDVRIITNYVGFIVFAFISLILYIILLILVFGLEERFVDVMVSFNRFTIQDIEQMYNLLERLSPRHLCLILMFWVFICLIEIFCKFSTVGRLYLLGSVLNFYHWNQLLFSLFLSLKLMDILLFQG